MKAENKEKVESLKQQSVVIKGEIAAKKIELAGIRQQIVELKNEVDAPVASPATPA